MCSLKLPGHWVSGRSFRKVGEISHPSTLGPTAFQLVKLRTKSCSTELQPSCITVERAPRPLLHWLAEPKSSSRICTISIIGRTGFNRWVLACRVPLASILPWMA